jgi:nitrous oxide reductase accessory protein NosL
MIRICFSLFLLFGLVYADSIPPVNHAKLLKKGKKVASKLCDKSKLSQIKSYTLENILKEIDTVQPCIVLNKRNKEALAYFLVAGASKKVIKKNQHITVPKEAKCPVCGMFVTKYPKWAARMIESTHTHYFDGVKDMMKFYIFDADFPYDRKHISQLEVTDFYTLQAIEAKKAFYVVGSDVFGPMGDELIPFSTKKAAQNFLTDHHGEQIILFDAITPNLVMGLDGLDYND